MAKVVWTGILGCVAAGAVLMIGVGFGAGGAGGGGGAAGARGPVEVVERPGAAGGTSVVGGAATGTSGAGVVRKKTEQMRGFSMRLSQSSEKAVNLYLKGIDELADMGCTWVNLPVAWQQDTAKSEVISPGPEEAPPSDEDILRIMARAKGRGMGIMMMPTVLLRNPGSKDWRGVINPTNWDKWFDQYNAFAAHMAFLAQKGGVDIFVVGSELLSTEPDRGRWVKTIAAIKRQYKGKLTYSANWDHYEAVSFWDQLDYVGMNNYYELAKDPGVPVAELNKTWGPIQEKILAFAAAQKKPFMFTEVGWHNLANTLSQPWNYVAESPLDLQEQARAYESFVEVWKGVPKEQFMGAFIWEWVPLEKPLNGKPPRGAYSLQETPALEVVKKWFGMP